MYYIEVYISVLHVYQNHFGFFRSPNNYATSVANKREYSLTWKGHLNIRIAPKSHLRNEPEI